MIPSVLWPKRQNNRNNRQNPQNDPTTGCIFNDDFEITESRAAEWTCCMLETVRYLHSKDIVHRDLKPENVVFRSDRGGHDIFLIDFGLSKRVMDLSVYNDLCANKWYTAPEVAAHYLCGEDERQMGNLPGYLTQISYGRRCPIQLTGAVWKAADIWAIGVMAYAMIARQLPFTGNKSRAIYERIVYDNLPMELDAASLSHEFGANRGSGADNG